MTTPTTTTTPNHPRTPRPEGDPAAVTTDHTPSRRCYQRGCPQPACKQADYQYMSRLRLEYHRGQRRRTEATQTRHHLERLFAIGWTRAQISRASGLSPRTIGDIVAGTPTVSKQTALAILSVPIGPPAADTRDVDATGTTRRLRALIAIGWPIAHLADRYGMYPTALGRIACGQLRQVRATTAHRIAVDYRELCRIPGPSQRARNEARKKGWHGPLAWDGAAIDDPNARPEVEQQVDELALKRDDLAAVRRAEIEHLAAFNVPTREIAARLGIAESTVNSIVRELRVGVTRNRPQQALKRHPEDLEAAA